MPVVCAGRSGGIGDAAGEAMSDAFDVIVLGSGVAGSQIARNVSKAGKRVLLIERIEFGGTCALRGCEPKKTFWTLADARDTARRLGPVALTGGENAVIDWRRLQGFKRSFTDPVAERSIRALQAAGVEICRGEASFADEATIRVGDRHYRFEHLVIATGAAPQPLPIEGAEHLTTSDGFLDLVSLPERILIVGGGYIAFEFAHIATRAGSDVTLVERAERPLTAFEPALVDRLVEHSRALGITIELGTEVSAIEPATGGYRVHATRGDRPLAWDCDMVVHASGRVPALDCLKLETGNVACHAGHLLLDEHLRSTTNPRVFAAGDAAQKGPALTPVATIDARAITAMLLDDNGRGHAPDYTAVPSVVFTIPPLTGVGMTARDLQDQGIDADLHEGDMRDFHSVRRVAEPAAAYRIYVHPSERTILGAHLLGPHAEEVINLFAFAMKTGTTADALRTFSTAYPSFSSNIAEMLG